MKRTGASRHWWLRIILLQEREVNKHVTCRLPRDDKPPARGLENSTKVRTQALIAMIKVVSLNPG